MCAGNIAKYISSDPGKSCLGHFIDPVVVALVVSGGGKVSGDGSGLPLKRKGLAQGCMSYKLEWSMTTCSLT